MYQKNTQIIIKPSLSALYSEEMVPAQHHRLLRPKVPEQNLLNHVHRWDGPMPWSEVDYKWNIRCQTENDFAKGLVSMHEKWWTQPYLYENQGVKDWLRRQRWEMKGWYDAWNLRHA
ncbi:hypothetical protein PMIN07_005077 [Paraphaeosphaeria minitans]